MTRLSDSAGVMINDSIWAVQKAVAVYVGNCERILWHLSDLIAYSNTALEYIYRAIAKIPAYESGSMSVPSTGLAVVHRGETIIPAGKTMASNSNLTINVNGPVYGINDLDSVIAASLDRTIRRGGFSYGFSG